MSVANTLWARTFMDTLAAAGLRDVVIAPGSRSTPLVMAAARHPSLRARVHLDERSAAFFALGVGKGTGRPAAVITTSGTAVANLLPAVVEASQSGVPLLLLTADRPPRLLGADANQAIDQPRIFGSYPREEHALGIPSADPREIRHLRTVAARAYGATTGPNPGPVHVNFPFDKPLEPVESGDLPGSESLPTLPPLRVRRGGPRLSDEVIGRVHALLDTGRGVVVAGPSEDRARLGPAVRAFAQARGWPLMADPLSGARFGATEGHVVAGYDLFIDDPVIREELSPEVVVRVGASPVSAALQRWLFAHADVPQIVVDTAGRWKDHGGTAHSYYVADPVDTLDRLHASTGDAQWLQRWRDIDAAARSALPAGSDAHEGAIARAVVDSLPTGSTLVVSNSMPIRDVDAFAHPSEKAIGVLANRGASGIDGVVSTAFGVAVGTDGVTVCLIGDVAFFHDQNGLLWHREDDARVVFVVVDNDGGGIFKMLPIADFDPDFTRFFTTPHGLDFSHAAAMHGIEYVSSDIEGLPSVLEEVIPSGRSAVVHVRTDGAAAHRRRLELKQDVVRRVQSVLGSSDWIRCPNSHRIEITLPPKMTNRTACRSMARTLPLTPDRAAVRGWIGATTLAILAVACGPNAALYHPSPEILAIQAPDSFLVDVATSEGTFSVKMRRHWSPAAVDRVYHLLDQNFYAGARIYRVVDGFVAQWGYSGEPMRDSVWRSHAVEDEPVVGSNVRGTISFARAGPRTRSFQLYVNLVDNERLDGFESGGVVGYPPIGEIEEGLEVVDGFYGAYAERTPSQDSIRILGNDYLRREYPQLDSIISTRVTGFWR